MKNGALLDPYLPEVVVAGQLADVIAIDQRPVLFEKPDFVGELCFDPLTDAVVGVAITL